MNTNTTRLVGNGSSKVQGPDCNFSNRMKFGRPFCHVGPRLTFRQKDLGKTIPPLIPFKNLQRLALTLVCMAQVVHRTGLVVACKIQDLIGDNLWLLNGQAKRLFGQRALEAFKKLSHALLLFKLKG